MVPELPDSPIDRRAFLGVGGAFVGGLGVSNAAEPILPAGAKAVWDLDKAHRDKTATRERVCLNGLWRWQPAKEKADGMPAEQWGYFKVPGFWPGHTSYIQEDCQTLHVHPDWKGVDVRATTAAWYQREMTVPEDWKGRRIALTADYVNSFAVVYVDGKKAGEIRFPGGEVDLTDVCRPGAKQELSLFVVALPLKGVLLSYTDTNSAREVKGTVDRRGLCGDVWLTSTPKTRITDVKIDTSTRKGEITLSTAIDGLAADVEYSLRVEIRSEGGVDREFKCKPFKAADVVGDRVSVSEKWEPYGLWNVNRYGHIFEASVSLVAAGRTQDTFHPVPFGYREFWIDGRDFYLNGIRLQLSAVPLDNAEISARTASYAGAVETFRRLHSFGINFVYTHNYGCEPGSHVSFEEVLRAADDTGMLVALSQPHFSHYDWKAADADTSNGYARHAEYYVREAQNHPSVVAYSMSHNATGYGEDMNPDLIDGLKDYRDDTWSWNNAALARRAEAIVKRLDPGRIVYHHSSGNLGSMHTVNFYLNFVPVQEMSDWFEHWATKGVKPVFLCEYGVPFTWDWTMYRGWYKGQREWGSAKVPWEFCLAEWNAQFLGDRAYRVTDAEKRNLRWEADQFRKGNLWHRWDYPAQVGSSEFDDRQEVLARYITDNWRAHRTWGLSANSPWEYAAYWKPRPGVDRRRKELKVDWDGLQKPGFSPDYVQPRQGWMSVDGEHNDWIATPAAEALIRNNQEVLAYIGGKPASFTSKDHIFLPGEAVEKQLIVINNSRHEDNFVCNWSLNVPNRDFGHKTVPVKPGEQGRVPIRFDLPENLAPGTYEIAASVGWGNRRREEDTFAIHVSSRPPATTAGGTVALFDQKSETSKLLGAQGVKFQSVEASTDLSGFDVLIVGKEALTAEEPGPDLTRVRKGLKVIVFEQSAKVLEQRLGFRIAEYGLREVFRRVPDHPLLAGIEPQHLRDWRGEATLLSSRLTYTMRPRYGPTVKWCGIEVPRPWRCGNRGNVASVLIEKPARGNFLPVLDGGYALQYSPLLEFREGKGMVLFCQTDVTGRTENDPAAETLAANIMRYVSAWKPTPRRKVLYAGDAAGRKHLEAAGLSPIDYARDKLDGGHLLIVGPGGGKELAGDARPIDKWITDGSGHVLALGLEQAEARSFLPFKVEMKKAEHIASYFEPPSSNSPLAGVGPADVHSRDPRELPLVSGGVAIAGNGVLAAVENAGVVFCQLVPWQFDPKKSMNLKRTFRRVSYLVSLLAANLGAVSETPVLARFGSPPKADERRWLDGLYLDIPEEWDDPYRFFRW
ncbi:MAG TPA: glycoside hydrolase family 2 TIM barrel-domain containing protein [Gemmataceae bacterium]|nr:glycoside hydrolase family 2 TIM barrel-domain containing protein [Gemmataceae bacterium]